jgi:tetratricopeptide (TPR) repeat protein
LTFDNADDRHPVWTPDGKRITFDSDRAKPGTQNLYWVNAGGTGDPARAIPRDSPTAWTANRPCRGIRGGKFLAFHTRDLMVLPMEGDATRGWKPGTPTPFLATLAVEYNPVFSPDGRFVAYGSSEGRSGGLDVYVRSFPGPGGKGRISTDGGFWPTWSATSHELLFLDADQRQRMVPSIPTANGWRSLPHRRASQRCSTRSCSFEVLRLSEEDRAREGIDVAHQALSADVESGPMPFRDLQRIALTLTVGTAISLGPALDAGQAGVQPVQYRSPEGLEYRSLPDTDAVKSARAALEAEPRNITRIIDLGVAQSGARQFREAIATFTRGLEIEPNNALLLRWRGHRYLSVREFDRAFADLTRGGAIDSTIYGIWYHLGVVQYLRGDFAEAAASFAKAQPIAPDAGELAGSTDWLWMSLSRAGRGAEAKAMLDRRPDSKPVTNAYTWRLQLYRGEIGPEAVVTSADTEDVQVATLAYGLGNWYLLRADKAQARRWFERSIQSGGWPGFGFIVSEVELRRLR